MLLSRDLIKTQVHTSSSSVILNRISLCENKKSKDPSPTSYLFTSCTKDNNNNNDNPSHLLCYHYKKCVYTWSYLLQLIVNVNLLQNLLGTQHLLRTY